MNIIILVASFIVVAVVVDCVALASLDPDKRKRPNILLLLTDDQDVLLGGTANMPFFDQHLTQQGTTLRNFFVHTPICCPSRSSILSGQYLHNNGVLNNSFSGNCDGPLWQHEIEQDTIGVFAQQAGYRTGYSGKYLNLYGYQGDNRVPPGWEKWLGLVGNSVYYNYEVVTSNDGATSSRSKHGSDYNDDYLPDLVANHTLKIIRELTTPSADSSSPLPPFLIVNAWPTPHAPFTPAPWAENLFNGSCAPRTPNWNASEESMQQKHWIMRQQSPIDTKAELRIDQVHQLRVEALQSVDQHIDQFVRLLKEQNALDNTIIIYTSDNGFQLGQHRLGGDKRHLYEQDVRVPFVVRGPDIPKNFTIDRIALNIDIAPTIYHVINDGRPLPDTMDGIPFLPIPYSADEDFVERYTERTDFLISYHGEGFEPCGLIDCPPPPHDNFHTIDSFNNTFHCVRSLVALNQTDFTYCEFDDEENFAEYYNNLVDPWQLKNIVHDLSVKQRNRLRKRLRELKACRGESCRPPLMRKPLEVSRDVEDLKVTNVD